jgi:hypothetical protein
MNGEGTVDIQASEMFRYLENLHQDLQLRISEAFKTKEAPVALLPFSSLLGRFKLV